MPFLSLAAYRAGKWLGVIERLAAMPRRARPAIEHFRSEWKPVPRKLRWNKRLAEREGGERLFPSRHDDKCHRRGEHDPKKKQETWVCHEEPPSAISRKRETRKAAIWSQIMGAERRTARQSDVNSTSERVREGPRLQCGPGRRLRLLHERRGCRRHRSIDPEACPGGVRRP